MYLPKAELQQWCGQTYCPYCIQDIRDDEKNLQAKQDARIPKTSGIPPDESGFEIGQKIGQKNQDYFCDQCQSNLDIVYVVADHKFCELCFQQQRKEWSERGIDAPPYMKFKVKESPGLLMRLIEFLKRKISEEWRRRNKKKDKKEGDNSK
ncbi:MAG: hypothetical protein AB1391_04725 [Candidatus Micrarchaeota archaeon]